MSCAIMSLLFARYPQFRRFAANAGRNCLQAAGLAAILLLASCSGKEPANNETDSAPALTLQDTPGQPVTNGEKPTQAEVEQGELKYHSNRWPEVKPEMRAYIDIHREGEKTQAASPGPGDRPAKAQAAISTRSHSAGNQQRKAKTAGGAEASIAASTAPDEAARKSRVIDQLKQDLAAIPEDGAAKSATHPKKTAEKKGSDKTDASPGGENEEETSETAVAKNSNAASPSDQRAMLGVERPEKNEQPALGQAGAPTGAQTGSNGRFGFAPLFAMLAAVLIVIVAVKRSRAPKQANKE